MQDEPKKTLFPLAHQVMIITNGKKPPLSRSIFIAFSAPILNLPSMIWRLVIVPLVIGIIQVVAFPCSCVWAGLRGRLDGWKISKEVAMGDDE